MREHEIEEHLLLAVEVRADFNLRFAGAFFSAQSRESRGFSDSSPLT